MKPLVISVDGELSVADVYGVATRSRKAVLAKEAHDLLAARRAEVEAFIAAHPRERFYGFNTGFGHNVDLDVGQGWLEELQRSLIRSHSSAVGPDADIEVVRAAMILRARSLTRGHSGVRPVVVQRLLDLLNAGITPAVPRFGSVSASGDLAPLSHIALALMGEGFVYRKGRRVPAGPALAAAKIPRLELEMKEGLALNNGVQYSTALGIVALVRLETLLKTAAIATALSTQVMLGADTPFRADLHALRPHPAAQKVAGWIFALMKGSPLREAHRDVAVDGEVQDPYNIRCAAQVLGTCAELAERARRTFTIEANSVTDNPVLLRLEAGEAHPWHAFAGQHVEIVSGGHFHGMPVAVDLYGLMQAVAMTATLVNLRCARAVDANRNKGLGSDLKWPGELGGAPNDEEIRRQQAISSALMIPEYATASLANNIWGLAMPSHLFSLSTDAGQEDHVSMAANVGLRVHDALARLADALAIELAFACQAAAIRKEMRRIPTKLADVGKPNEVRIGGKVWHRLEASECRLSEVSEALLGEIGKHFAVIKTDRSLSGELGALAGAVLAGSFVECAEANGMAF